MPLFAQQDKGNAADEGDAMTAFTEHYQSAMAIDYTNLPYWDLCAALRLIRLGGPHLAEWAARPLAVSV